MTTIVSHTFTEFSGMDWLRIDIANNFGLDKELWEDRIQWTNDHEDRLEDMLEEAEEPALFHAGVQAYRAAQRGEPIGYPISLDATASGLQFLACLSGCETSARLCNVVPTGMREDAYTNLYRGLLKRTEALQQVIQITRAQAKDGIMTSLYGSTAVPKKHFGEGPVLDAFYQTMEQDAPGAWALNKALLSLWQPHAYHHSWRLPDNFHAHIKVMDSVVKKINFQKEEASVIIKRNQPSEDGLSIGANVIHSIDGMMVREMHRRCTFDRDRIIEVSKSLLENQNQWEDRLETDDDIMVKVLWDHYQESGFLSARILDHLRVENILLTNPERIVLLLKTMPEKSFPLISIHDCFRCHPSYANDVRRQYNRILAEIASSDLLSFIASQILGQPVPVTKMKDLSRDILQANYALS